MSNIYINIYTIYYIIIQIFKRLIKHSDAEPYVNAKILFVNIYNTLEVW